MSDMTEQSTAWRLEAIYHPAIYVLIEGLKAMNTTEARKILRDWDAARAIVDALIRELDKPKEGGA